MCKRNGFTLIELLVVVGVVVFIAILVFCARVFMHAQNRAKIQANEILCQTNLKQWGLIFSMYTEDNNGYFSGCGKITDARQAWIVPLLPYVQQETNLLYCPDATKQHPNRCSWGGTFYTYDIHILGYMMGKGERSDWNVRCSYGANSWIYNPPPNIGNLQGRPTEWNWRTPNVKDAALVPVFADTMWRGGGPYSDGVRGEPPPHDGQWVRYDREMMHFCINRHNGAINHLFMDWSVRKVGLKELWKLKWHRQFDTAGPWTKTGGAQPSDWPGWMSNFKDY
jgi:prepilin-type N-terminal cleavage/methylation domain-containing protein